DGVEVLRGEVERHATVPAAVLVPALEALSGAAQEDRAGGHQLAAAGRRTAVLEGARGHDGDRDLLVLLAERPVLGTVRADDVLHAPALALGDEARLHPPSLVPCSRRNFRHDPFLALPYIWITRKERRMTASPMT